jgi:hypothetical protein
MKLQSAVEYLVTYGWAIIIIAIVLAMVYELGYFNPSAFTNNQCIFPADFSCTYSQLSQTGNLLITLEQETGTAVNVTALGCNQNSSITNMVAYSGANQIYLPTGATVNVTMTCYNTHNAIYSGSVGNLFNGYILINYTSSETAFPHTQVGTLVQKVT